MEHRSSALGRWRKLLSIYAVANAAVYALVVLIGALAPVQLLISFELMILFTAPNIMIFLILNGWRYYRLRNGLDLALLGTWVALGATLGAYYLYLERDITQRLWAEGIWFSENDVLHIGLILWMIYIALFVVPRIEDAPGSPP